MLRRTLPFLLSTMLFGLACNVGDDAEGLSPNSGFNNVVECGTDELPCDGECVSATAVDNCGACGNVCATGETCVEGACELACPAGEVLCDDGCIDPAADPLFCGASADCQGANAGEACAADDVCIAGICECVTDNAGFTVSDVSGTAAEGGEPVTYTVVLNDEPCSPVTVQITPDDQVEVNADSLTFDPSNWDEAQTVEVSALLDATREMEHTATIEHAVTSDDAAYEGFAVDSVTVEIADRATLRKVVVGLDGDEPDGHSYTPDVSDDGRYVVFLSKATNLTNDAITDTSFNQVFWRDLESGETRLVSSGLNGPGDGNSTQPRISADGQTVTFASQSTNLTMTTTGSDTYEIFVYSVADDAVSQISDPCTECTSRSVSPAHSMTADGDLIAYATRRQILSTDLSNEVSVYTYRRSTQTLELASVNSDGDYPTRLWGNNIFSPNLSANGRYLGWRSAGGNLVSPDPTLQNFHSYFKDLDTGEVRRASSVDEMQTPCRGSYRSTSSGSPFVANDGATAVFSTLCPMDESDSAYATTQIYVWDDAAQTNTRITQGETDLPDGESRVWDRSDDGRYSLIASRATNLAVADGPDNSGAVWQLYVYDSDSGEMTAVNFGLDYRWSTFGVAYVLDEATASDSPTWASLMSGNGQHVVYATVDPMLLDETTTPMEFANIYVVTLF